MDELVYKYNGAKALVALHEIHLRSFYKTWQEAKKLELNFPKPLILIINLWIHYYIIF
ncbi:MAG: hypothetical protein IPH97_16165 [Ignavibacteriales bacterium]|nr:hypothetical protein [Ignavibacteriales bacterium]